MQSGVDLETGIDAFKSAILSSITSIALEKSSAMCQKT
jgi:hypothetical protein